MSEGKCPLGEDCDLTLAYMMGAEKAKDTIKALRAENERLRAALESAEAWLERWAVHVGRCEGGLRCTCGLTAIRYDVSAALEEAPQGRISEAAAQPAPSGWRPIETAPRNGTQFLTWDSHYGIRVGRCVVRPDHDDWLSYMDAYKGSSKGGIRATHWMPLPPAPGKEEA